MSLHRTTGTTNGNGRAARRRTIPYGSFELPTEDHVPTLRIGVVGCGYWGAKHVRVLVELSRSLELTVIDPSEERRRSIGRSFPSVRRFGSLDDVLDDLDAIVVATPPSTHHRIASAALRAGKDVLVEKPMTTSSDEARELIALADQAGAVLMVGHTFEYNAAVTRLRSIIHSGALGRIYYVDSARLNLGLYRPDVNVVWDLAPHDVSILNHTLGSSPRSVEAWGDSHAHDGREDVAYLRLHYDDPKVTALAQVSWLSPSKVRRLTVVGSEKMAVYNDLLDNERIRIFDKGVEVPPGALHDPPLTYRYGSITAPYIPFEEPLQVQNRHFLDCVANRERPRTDGDVGLAVVATLEATERALREGGRVRIDAEVHASSHGAGGSR